MTRTDPRSISDLVESVVMQCRWLSIPVPEREVTFHPTRKWRFDLAWPAFKVACEVQGGTFIKAADGAAGRHSRGGAQTGDMEKLNEAQLLGWLVIVVDTKMVNHRDGRAVKFIERALRARKPAPSALGSESSEGTTEPNAPEPAQAPIWTDEMGLGGT